MAGWLAGWCWQAGRGHVSRPQPANGGVVNEMDRAPGFMTVIGFNSQVRRIGFVLARERGRRRERKGLLYHHLMDGVLVYLERSLRHGYKELYR